jgi:RimJ/RimL family protein N-acetyltransferase
MMLPTFETRRLTITPVGMDDVDGLWAVWHEADVRRFLFDDEPVSRDRAAEIVRAALARFDVRLGLWVLRERGSPTVLGAAGLQPAADTARYAPALAGITEIVVSLARAAWGKGYATEALEPVLHYAFATRGDARLVAVVDVPNESSHRLMLRLGFVVTGECDGPRHRLRTYVLTKERFPVQRVGADS